ncbi:MAG: stage V sporulation protein B [Candidatus Improbicoccus devescovinae]|nr:MAG: stage V sporulation protein B [Candidatus Improbicoccus devescovinae]
MQNNISCNKNTRKHHSFAMGAVIITFGMLTVKVLGAVFKIPLMAMLGGEGGAYFTGAYNFYNPIYALSTAGLPIAISKLVSENVALGRFKDVRRIHKITVPMFLTTGSIGFIFTVIGGYIYIKLANSPGSLYSIFMLAPTLLFSCLISSYRGYYEGLRDMTPTAISEIIESAGKVVFGLSLTYLTNWYTLHEYNKFGTVFGKYFADVNQAKAYILPFASGAALAGVALSSVLGFIYIALRYKIKGDYITKHELENSPKANSRKFILKSILKLSIPIALGAVVMNFAGVIDSILIQRRLSDIAGSSLPRLLISYKNLISEDIISRKVVHSFLFGCFGYTSMLTMFLPTLAQGLAISALPAITSAWVRGAKKDIHKNIETIIKLAVIVSVPMGVGLSALSLPILNLIYNHVKSGQVPEIYIASDIMAISGIGAIFTAISTPICSMLQAVGRADLPVKILSIGVVIKIILNYILVGIPEINIQGAGIGTLICYIFVFLSALYNLCRITKIKLNYVSVFIKPTIAAVLCGLSAWVSYNLFYKICTNLSLKFITMLSIIISMFVYFILILCLKTLTINDINMLPQKVKTRVSNFFKKFDLI